MTDKKKPASKKKALAAAQPDPNPGVNARLLAAIADQTGAPCPYSQEIGDVGDNTGTVPKEVQATFALAAALEAEAMAEIRAAAEKLARSQQIGKTAKMLYGELDPRVTDMEHMAIGADWRVAFGGESLTESLNALNEAKQVAAFRRIFPSANDASGQSIVESLMTALKDGGPGGFDIGTLLKSGGPMAVDLGDLTGTDLGERLSSLVRGFGESGPNEKGEHVTDETEIRNLVAEMPELVAERVCGDSKTPQAWKDFIREPLTMPIPKGLKVFKSEDGTMSLRGTIATVEQVH